METITAALIGFIGVIIGTTISSINNSILKTKEAKLRVVEKVFDRRINAHEQILELMNRLRTIWAIEKADENSNMLGYPSCMETKEKLTSFSNDASYIIQYNCHWFDTNLERELWFMRDYLMTLNMNVKDIDDDKLPEVGLIVKQDSIDIAASVDSIAFDFFRKDIYKIKISKHDKWHKYKRTVTDERLNKTRLFSHYDEIQKIKNGA